MVYIKRSPTWNMEDYAPGHVPAAIDFHAASQDLPIDRATKNRMQIALSKMGLKEVKDTKEYLKEMRYAALGKGHYKMAAYCKAVKEFVDNYITSLKKQKKI